LAITLPTMIGFGFGHIKECNFVLGPSKPEDGVTITLDVFKIFSLMKILNFLKQL
jgi:hypothetical protein